MEISLVNLDRTNKNQLKMMFEVYVDEMRVYLDSRAEQTRPVVASEILTRYLAAQPRWPYLIEVHGDVAGFSLLRRFPPEPDAIDVDQFYVSDAFRRQGIGGHCLKVLTEAHTGRWIVRVLNTNHGALKFWLNAIEACVGSKYQQTDEVENMHYIRFDTRDTVHTKQTGYTGR